MTGSGVRHALVARLDGAGDVLLAGPAIRAVAAGSERVTLLCGPAGREPGALLPGVDEVHVVEAPWVPLRPGPFDPAAVDDLRAWLAGAEIDLAVVLTSFHQSPLPLALLCKLAGVPVVVAASEDHPGSLVDVRRRPEWDGDDHEVERSLRLVEMAGFRLPAGDAGALVVDLPVPPPPAEPYLVLHPGASVPARAIPADAAAGAVELLTRRGHRVVVTGGPGEEALAAAVAGAGGERVEVVAGRMTFADLASLLAAASVVVSGNTGPAHLAAAVGTPVVSVFAAVVPWSRWRPWGVPHRALGDQGVPCAGCRARECPLPGQPCLAPATATAIADAAEALLPRWGNPPVVHAAGSSPWTS